MSTAKGALPLDQGQRGSTEESNHCLEAIILQQQRWQLDVLPLDQGQRGSSAKSSHCSDTTTTIHQQRQRLGEAVK